MNTWLVAWYTIVFTAINVALGVFVEQDDIYSGGCGAVGPATGDNMAMSAAVFSGVYGIVVGVITGAIFVAWITPSIEMGQNYWLAAIGRSFALWLWLFVATLFLAGSMVDVAFLGLTAYLGGAITVRICLEVAERRARRRDRLAHMAAAIADAELKPHDAIVSVDVSQTGRLFEGVGL